MASERVLKTIRLSNYFFNCSHHSKNRYRSSESSVPSKKQLKKTISRPPITTSISVMLKKLLQIVNNPVKS